MTGEMEERKRYARSKGKGAMEEGRHARSKRR